MILLCITLVDVIIIRQSVILEHHFDISIHFLTPTSECQQYTTSGQITITLIRISWDKERVMRSSKRLFHTHKIASLVRSQHPLTPMNIYPSLCSRLLFKPEVPIRLSCMPLPPIAVASSRRDSYTGLYIYSSIDLRQHTTSPSIFTNNICTLANGSAQTSKY